MSVDSKELQNVASEAVVGTGAYAAPKNVLEGLPWTSAGTRPEGAPYSILQILNHLVYWQEWAVVWLDEGEPAIPPHAEGSWPGGEEPSSEAEWNEAVRRFLEGQQRLQKRCGNDLLRKKGAKTRLQMLVTIALHNAYHLGQIVALRRILGHWPPPSGGLTW